MDMAFAMCRHSISQNHEAVTWRSSDCQLGSAPSCHDLRKNKWRRRKRSKIEVAAGRPLFPPRCCYSILWACFSVLEFHLISSDFSWRPLGILSCSAWQSRNLSKALDSSLVALAPRRETGPLNEALLASMSYLHNLPRVLLNSAL